MIHIGVVLQKVMAKVRIVRLEHDRRLVIARLAELERAIDGPYDREVSRQIDQAHKWIEEGADD